MNQIITPNQGLTMTTSYTNGQSRVLRPMSSRLSKRVQTVPPSGIRKYFDIAWRRSDDAYRQAPLFPANPVRDDYETLSLLDVDQ